MALDAASDLTVPQPHRRAVDQCVARLVSELPAAGLSLIAYGSAVRGGFVAGRSDINLLVILPAATPTAVATIAAASEAGRKFGLAPVVLGRDELPPLARSAPLALWDIADRRLLLHGDDPLAELPFELADLWRQLTFELRDKLLGLRHLQLTGQRPKPPEAFGRRLASSLLHLFRAALRLYGRPALQNRVAAMGDAARHLQLDLAVLQRLHNGCYGDEQQALRDLDRLLADSQGLLAAALASLEALAPEALPASPAEPVPEPVAVAEDSADVPEEVSPPESVATEAGEAAADVAEAPAEAAEETAEAGAGDEPPAAPEVAEPPEPATKPDAAVASEPEAVTAQDDPVAIPVSELAAEEAAAEPVAEDKPAAEQSG